MTRRSPAIPGAHLFAPAPTQTGHPGGADPARPGPQPGPSATHASAERGRRAGKTLRFEAGWARTAVLTLGHANGRTVTLIGTMHIGDPGYFRELSAVVERLAAGGTVIQVEGISHRHDDRLTRWEHARLAEADGWTDPETAGAAAFRRAESQATGLQLPADATNIDLSHGELLRRVGWRNYRRLFASQPASGAEPVANAAVRAAVRLQLRHTRLLEGLKAVRPRNRHVNRVVIGERNRIAFAGAVEALAGRDVALIWGADHLPGLARLFHQAGYRLRQQTWFAAWAV